MESDSFAELGTGAGIARTLIKAHGNDRPYLTRMQSRSSAMMAECKICGPGALCGGCKSLMLMLIEIEKHLGEVEPANPEHFQQAAERE